jgi:predicted RNA binding protein YcfA (HicA-like mRNA interferase family)
MPGRLRWLSGRDVVSILAGFGFQVIPQRGSHARLRRVGSGGEKQTLAIPLHDDLDRGTLRALLRQASRYVPEAEVSFPKVHDLEALSGLVLPPEQSCVAAAVR